jgi:hypothetical protein
MLRALHVQIIDLETLTRGGGSFLPYLPASVPCEPGCVRDIAEQNWVQNRSAKWNVPVSEAPKGRRHGFVEPYFKRAKPDQVVTILKAREPAPILIAIGNQNDNRGHLQLAERWVVQPFSWRIPWAATA